MRRLLRPDASSLDQPSLLEIAKVAGVVGISFMVYGLTLGYWRSPTMGLYVAAKMPMLIAATLGCNWLLNGMLGLLLGSGLGFRQSFHALLSAFAISGLILGSVAPVTWFLALNAPSPDAANAETAHSGYLLAHTLLIAVAGVIGLTRLIRMLKEYCPSDSIALSTFSAWLIGNAFLGMQFSYVFRPFFGNPTLKIEFLRPNPLAGSFYSVVWNSLKRVTGTISPDRWFLVILALGVGTLIFIAISRRKSPSKLLGT